LLFAFIFEAYPIIRGIFWQSLTNNFLYGIEFSQEHEIKGEQKNSFSSPLNQIYISQGGKQCEFFLLDLEL